MPHGHRRRGDAGFGRALGETMAVTMVIGNDAQISRLAVRPSVHDGRGPRERVHRSSRRALSERAVRSTWCCPPSRHRQRADCSSGPWRASPDFGLGLTACRLAVVPDAAIAGRTLTPLGVCGVLAAAGACWRWPRWPRAVLRDAGRARRSVASPFRRHAQARRRTRRWDGECDPSATLMACRSAARSRLPIGIVSGIHISEYAGSHALASVGRDSAADTLNGVPSIVVGVFVYGFAVLPFNQFSAIAVKFALGVMMIVSCAPRRGVPPRPGS